MSSPETTFSSSEISRPEISTEFLRDYLQEITYELRLWHETQESDSVSAQRARSVMFGRQSQELEVLVSRVGKSNAALQLEIGKKGITSWWFDKGPYDFYSAKPKKMAAHDSLNINHTCRFADSLHLDSPAPKEFYQASELYIGDYAIYVPTSTLARTLAEGGQLTLVEQQSPQSD